MNNDEIVFKPIGIIRTPFLHREGMPIQPAGAKGAEGMVELYPEFAEGLSDVEGFSHVILIYYLHRVKGFQLRVVPFLDDVERGIFATRSPVRPNPIGLSSVEVVSVHNSTLRVKNIDVLDGTPLLDIKPFVPMFDDVEVIKTGWLEGRGIL